MRRKLGGTWRFDMGLGFFRQATTKKEERIFRKKPPDGGGHDLKEKIFKL
jgi:hypothetical protein